MNVVVVFVVVVVVVLVVAAAAAAAAAVFVSRCARLLVALFEFVSVSACSACWSKTPTPLLLSFL